MLAAPPPDAAADGPCKVRTDGTVYPALARAGRAGRAGRMRIPGSARREAAMAAARALEAPSGAGARRRPRAPRRRRTTSRGAGGVGLEAWRRARECECV